MSKQKQKKLFLYTTFSELVSSMNNHSSYYELNDAKMRASEKDLPVIYLLKNP